MALPAKVYHKYRGQVTGDRSLMQVGGGKANQKANGKWQKSKGKSLRSSPSLLRREGWDFDFYPSPWGKGELLPFAF
jgi:hypothetical protein